MKTQTQYNEVVRRSYESSVISESEEFEEAKQDAKRNQKRIAGLEEFFKAVPDFYFDRIHGNQIGLADIDALRNLSDKTYGRIGRLFKYDQEWKELTNSENSLPECEQAGSLLAKYAEAIDKKIRTIEAKNKEY